MSELKVRLPGPEQQENLDTTVRPAQNLPPSPKEEKCITDTAAQSAGIPTGSFKDVDHVLCAFFVDPNEPGDVQSGVDDAVSLPND